MSSEFQRLSSYQKPESQKTQGGFSKMPIARFPDPRSAFPSDRSVSSVESALFDPGLIAIGGDFHPFSLIQAYKQGIFPWPHGDENYLWFCPNPRGVFFFHKLHLSQSLKKTLKKAHFHFSIDQCFEKVLLSCAETPRPDQQGTWISKEIKAAYLELHRLGIAHSVEVWNSQNQLVGGLYGVAVEGVFSAESMFYLESGASKAALIHLIETLSSRGAEWIDIQTLTPHLKAMGAEEMPRSRYLDLLSATQIKQLKLF